MNPHPALLAFPLCVIASPWCSAQFITIDDIPPDPSNVAISWDGEGVLQTAQQVDGPWSNDTTATSPHIVPVTADHEFFRAFYPKGFPPQFEPPGLALAEPNESPSRTAEHMSRGWFVPEIGDEVLLHSGETRRTEIDLRIQGRGMDFIWARCYRSRYGPDTAQGDRWDFSYNVHIEGGGPHVKVFDGSGYSAYFVQQPDGSYAADQFFREGEFDSNGVFRLTFADTGFWEFRPLGGQPGAGKISRIVDRNANQLSFVYDSLGRLTDVTDTLNRNIQIAYNRDGFIESVTDFSGREVRYEYYQDVDIGGSFGDLKSARSPIVTNTPTLNDFPLGKTTTYAYSEGFADERENHLLVSITDPKGQTSREYVYQHNQSDIEFLRCLSRRVGHSTDVLQYHYVEQTPAPSNQFATLKAIVNDRVGNVSEHFLDADNRLVMLREYTGRADPAQQTTESANRPIKPLRTNDPPVFETIWEWNADSLATRVVHPNGNSVSNVYESTLNPGADPRARGNLREHHLLPGPLGGDQSELVETWTYDPRFGTDARYDPDKPRSRGFGFVTFEDASAATTSFEYDPRGNCTNITHRIPTIVEDFEYNAFGQMTEHVLPDNGSGHRRSDSFSYYTGGPQAGYLQQRVVDAGPGGFNLVTTFEYDGLGRVTRTVDPRGNDEMFLYNALDQPVHYSTKLHLITGQDLYDRHSVDLYYDANDNNVRICESNADQNGLLDPGNAYITRLMEHDILDRLVRVCAESGSFDVPRTPPQLDCTGLPAAEFVTTEYEYDANRNLTLVRLGEATEGRDSNNTVRAYYDERDLVFQQVRAEGAANQSTTRYDYDGNGNSLITYTGLESVPRVTQFAYDGYDRRTGATDATGNAVSWNYDENGNVVSNRVDGELLDLSGSAGNVRLAENAFEYDNMDRLTRRDRAFFHTVTQAPLSDGQSTHLFTWTDTSQLLTDEDDNSRTNLYSYDRANRLSVRTDAAGNQVVYAYDANSNPTNVGSVEKSDLGNPDQTFATRFVYDELDRLIQMSDNVSNTVQYAYDSRGNRVLTTDSTGAQTAAEYDGLNRLLRTAIDMNGNGPNPAEAIDIVLQQTWDDSSRLVGKTDDNTNTTVYVYDALNRRIQEVLADGTGVTNSYDAHDNRVTLRDANGNAVGYAYDLLNRVTNTTVVPGPGVSSDTTFERFRYDGVSRLVRAQDDDSLVVLSYNSLGSVLLHQANGKTTVATYDGEGNTIQCTYPGGRIVGYSYDPLNRIRAILDASLSEQCTYDFIGPDRMERMDYANRTRTDYSYDGITGVPNPGADFGVKRHIRTLHTIPATGAVIDDRAYRWDRRYSKTARIDQRTTGPALRHDYEYDPANRMNKAQITDSLATVLRDTGYTLDGVGNRTAVTNNSVVETYTMDPTSPVPADFQVNQYTADSLGTLAYDENGNLKARNPGMFDERLYEFDYANRLVRLIDPGSSVTNDYSYDTLGRRIETVVSSPALPPQVTRYLYGADGSSHANALQVVEEQDGLGATLATYVYGGGVDDVLNMQRGGNDYHFHHDDLGDVIAVTDGSATVVERYEYGDFGEPMFFDGAGTPRTKSAIGNPYLFTGRRYDAGTGLYYYRARYLDPLTGRFITRDPLGTWGDPANAGNGLSYVGNNPWTHTDPMGLAKEQFVRSKPHVNIGTIGGSSHSGHAAKKAREIVVVGSKVRSKKLFVGGLSWNAGGVAKSQKLFVGGLAWSTDDSPLPARRKQSLYFPEQMLKEIQNEASAHGYPDDLKNAGDPVPAVSNPVTISVYWHVIKRASGSSGQTTSHPDFLWIPYANHTSDSGHHDVMEVYGWNHEVVSPLMLPSFGFAGQRVSGSAVDDQDILHWQRNLGAVGASSSSSSAAEKKETITIQVGYSDNFLN